VTGGMQPSDEHEARSANPSPDEVASHNERGTAGGVPVLTFDAGIPGFPDLRRFEVVPCGEGLDPFCWMRSLERPEVAFVVAPPGCFFEDYYVRIDDQSVERLGIRDASDVVVLVIITLAMPPARPTANLLGPIVINRRTLKAMQVVQYHTSLPVATPLPERVRSEPVGASA
jgi:flagellar assembly factor FliW